MDIGDTDNKAIKKSIREVFLDPTTLICRDRQMLCMELSLDDNGGISPDMNKKKTPSHKEVLPFS